MRSKEGYSMNYKFYLIKLLTDMHVGSGDMDFGVIDNQVQRDVITEIPTINASSLKGAIKDFFIYRGKQSQMSNVFGDENRAGDYKFFSANLVSYPVRSNKRPFYRATCPLILNEFINWLETLKVNNKYKEVVKRCAKLLSKNDEPIILESDKNIIIEDFKVETAQTHQFKDIEILEKLLGDNIVLFSDKDFRKLMKQLPVIPRNHLENGISKNLWYEEIIPRETRFYFITMVEKKCKNEQFEAYLTDNIIQIGANATIGYGYSKISSLSIEGEQNG